MAPHAEALICVDKAKGGIIEFRADSNNKVAGRTLVSRLTSEGGATGRQLRHASMLAQGKHAGSSARAQRSGR